MAKKSWRTKLTEYDNADFYQQLKPIRNLPPKLKSLHRQMANYRIYGRLWDDQREVTELSYVRHKYTNYEQLLEQINAVPLPKRMTRNDKMDLLITYEKIHKRLKDMATQLASQMLTEAYGENENWQLPLAMF